MKTTSPTPLAAALAAAIATAAAGHPLAEETIARIDSSSAPLAGEPSLAEVRAATERFRDVDVALAEGYVRDPGNICDTAPMMGKPAELGGMGIHFVRPDLLGLAEGGSDRVDGTGTHTDFLRPSVLIYDPHADGSLQLVAVENLVFKEAWHAAGNVEPPSFHGVAYDLMQDDPTTEVDEAHMFAPHYDRHVWLYRENPAGVFAQFNPTVTCEHHVTRPAGGHGHGS